jgi:hypothetical protein
MTNRLITARPAGGLFFPVAGSMGLSARGTTTPKLTEKIVWAGSNLGSYAMAEEAARQLAEQEISAGRTRRHVKQVGDARLVERASRVAELKAIDLPSRRRGSSHREAPQVAVVMMDGGRYQRRDHFAARGEGKSRGAAKQEASTHWRETKVGCLLSMTSQVHGHDPCAEIPDDFAHASAVQEIAKVAANTGSNACSGAPPDDSTSSTATMLLDNDASPYKPPKLNSRDVVASGQSSDEFGWQLEVRARKLNFPVAQRQAFVADGAKTNWRIQQEHFPDATPIADLMHALSYAWSASKIDEGEATYQKWAQLIWQGDVAEAIEHLETLQSVHGGPPQDAPSDLRHHVDRALTYFRNNATHMNYPAYRQQGLPITSAHIESTVKLINRRIKGTEKFWERETSEGVLQLRADYLSDSNPMADFWRRYHASQIGSNAYQHAGKELQSA